MDRLLTKDEVQAQLNAKSGDITRRMDAIQDEVLTTGESLRKAIAENPMVGVGGAVAAGLVVGLMAGGKKKQKDSDLGGSASTKALVEGYIRAVAAEAGKSTKKGVSTDEAVQKALRNRLPIVIYNADSVQEKGGFIHDTFDLMFKTALGFAVKIGMDFVTARFNLQELAAPLQSQGGTDAAAPVAAFTSED